MEKNEDSQRNNGKRERKKHLSERRTITVPEMNQLASEIQRDNDNQPGPSHRRETTNDTTGHRRSASVVCTEITEDAVLADSEAVVRSFMVATYNHNWEQAVLHNDGDAQTSNQHLLLATGDIPELQQYPDAITPSIDVGRRLARLGDEFMRRHEHEIDDMVQTLVPDMANLTAQRAFDAFHSVARRVLSSGTNWGRITALLCFGYRLSMALVRRGIPSFISQGISFILRVLHNEHLTKWIAHQGGWMAVLFYRPDFTSPLNWRLIANISLVGVAMAAIVAIVGARQATHNKF